MPFLELGGEPIGFDRRRVEVLGIEVDDVRDSSVSVAPFGGRGGLNRLG